MGEHNRVRTLHVDVGRVAMAGRYAEIGKTVCPVCSKFATSQLFRKVCFHLPFSKFLKNHLKRADKLFCELEDFDANFGFSITVY